MNYCRVTQTSGTMGDIENKVAKWFNAQKSTPKTNITKLSHPSSATADEGEWKLFTGKNKACGIDGLINLLPDANVPFIMRVTCPKMGYKFAYLPCHVKVRKKKFPKKQKGEIRVAIIDVAFDFVETLRKPKLRRILGIKTVWIGSFKHYDLEIDTPPLVPINGHGACSGAEILSFNGDEIKVGFFEIPNVGDKTDCGISYFLGPFDIRNAIMDSCGRCFDADVVSMAMCDARWGVTDFLKDSLKKALKEGRNGKGAVIVCSVGDSSCNSNQGGFSAAIGVDEICSQPWVIGVGGCDNEGQWLRNKPQNFSVGENRCISRFGPAVFVSANGERQSGELAMDDTSLSASLTAGAIALALHENPELTFPEISQLLAWTSKQVVHIDVEQGPDIEHNLCNQFNYRDRLGHNFKVGYGQVMPDLLSSGARDVAVLSFLLARLVPDTSDSLSSLRTMIKKWSALTDKSKTPLCQAYNKIKQLLVRACLRSIWYRENFCWIARHLLAISTDISSWQVNQDHGAFFERISALLQDLTDEDLLKSELPFKLADEIITCRDDINAIQEWLSNKENEKIAVGNIRYVLGK